MIVSYDDIEKIVTRVESDLEGLEQQFADVQSLFLEVLQTQMFPLLEKSQRDLLLFICTTLYFAISKKTKTEMSFDLESFMESEEANWQTKEASKDWNECKDQFFKNYEEEDMLAFVEDMSAAGDDHQINDSDVEVIFICCKSYIDQFELEDL